MAVVPPTARLEPPSPRSPRDGSIRGMDIGRPSSASVGTGSPRRETTPGAAAAGSGASPRRDGPPPSADDLLQVFLAYCAFGGTSQIVDEVSCLLTCFHSAQISTFRSFCSWMVQNLPSCAKRCVIKVMVIIRHSEPQMTNAGAHHGCSHATRSRGHHILARKDQGPPYYHI